MRITHSVILTPHKLVVDGNIVATGEGTGFVTNLYRERIGDYPKFFKMDALCKVGFVASEMLLRAEKEGAIEQRVAYNTAERAIVLFNATSSLSDDTNYQKTINDAGNYYPSPSVFVYTLPNIVTGEIAIRNRYYGEINFIVLAKPDAAMMTKLAENAFCDSETTSILSGWIDCYDEENFDVRLFIAEKDKGLSEKEIADLLKK